MKVSALISLFGAAAGVLGAPAEQQQQGPIRRPVSGPFRKDRPLSGNVKPLTTQSEQYVQSPWGGSVQESRGWRTVTGTTVIPRVTGQSSSAGAAAWVGIDGKFGIDNYLCDKRNTDCSIGARCSNAILQTGVVAWGDGSVEAWYEWWPYSPVYYGSRFPVKAGDNIRMSVNATSTNSGTSTLENLTTGKKVTTPYSNMGYNLCLTDAEWIIEFGGGATAFADFGTWDITNTHASGDSGEATAAGGDIHNVIINNHQYTNCGANSNGMECTWQ